MSELVLFGIRLRVHLLFWLVLLLSIAAGYFVETLTLFAIVFIHELGHVAAARELGWHVREIQLLPFGGVATVEEELTAPPQDELVVALAGPFMNVAMIAVSWLFWQAGWWSVEWTRFFMESNLLIAGFNLLPIWPLDGGRILQALLCLLLPYRRAALLSLGVSTTLAACLLGMGAYSAHLNLMAVATYLAVAGAQAFTRFPYQYVRFLVNKYKSGLDPERIRSVRVDPATTVRQAAFSLRKGRYHLFWIGGRDGGLLPEERLLHAMLVEGRHETAIARLL